jgi:hypothetical protein
MGDGEKRCFQRISGGWDYFVVPSWNIWWWGKELLSKDFKILKWEILFSSPVIHFKRTVHSKMPLPAGGSILILGDAFWFSKKFWEVCISLLEIKTLERFSENALTWSKFGDGLLVWLKILPKSHNCFSSPSQKVLDAAWANSGHLKLRYQEINIPTPNWGKSEWWTIWGKKASLGSLVRFKPITSSQWTLITLSALRHASDATRALKLLRAFVQHRFVQKSSGNILGKRSFLETAGRFKVRD